MNIRSIAFGLVAALAALPVLADNVDGQWAASVESPQGNIDLTIDLKADGEKLAGTISAGPMGTMPISEGVVKGADVSFKLTIDAGGMPLVILYKGKVAGDQRNLVSKMDMGQGEPIESPLVAKRVKPAAAPAK
jgi:hypothetical protein